MNEVEPRSNNLFLSLSSATDEKLVARLLGEDYTIWLDDHDITKNFIDLVVVDSAEMDRLFDKISAVKMQSEAAYVPIMVMVSNERLGTAKMWEIADDVVAMPVSKKNLQTRIKGMIKIRSYSNRVKVKQDELEKKNRQLQLYNDAIDATISGMVITDASKEDNPIIFCNKAFTKLTGYSQIETIGKNCRFLQHDDRDQQARDIIRNAVENEEPCEVLLRNYRKDGSLFWNELKISPIKNQNGEVEYFVGIQNDVTELIETQEMLKSAKDQWESIVSQSPNLIMIVIDGIIRFINKVGANFIGFDHPDEVIGKSVFDLPLKSGNEAHDEKMEKLNDTDKSHPMIYIAVDNTGTTRYIKVQSIPITYEGESAAQTVGVDVTRIKESEMDLAKLLEQKEILVQEVHHRVKNNLAIISGLIEMQIPSLDNEEAVSYLRSTQMRIISIAKVHEMLYNRKNLNEVELGQYIEQLVDSIKSTGDLKKQEMDVGLDKDSILLSLDQAIPCGLLLNELMTNSIKHGFDEGETIKIDINVSEENENVTIRYRDYGKGMPESSDFVSEGKFGSTIILILIEQLNAEYTLETRDGVQMTISFQRMDYHGPYKKLTESP